MTKQRMPQPDRQSKTKQLLLVLAEYMGERLGELVDITTAQMSPRDRRILAHGGVLAVRDVWAREEHQRQKELLRALKRQRWITEQKVGNRIMVALTEKGRAVVFKERLCNAPACMKSECIIVIFDVPESERKTRRQFRLFLKQCKFTQLQKSVWMHGCDVLETMKQFIRETKSERWVKVFRAHGVTIE